MLMKLDSCQGWKRNKYSYNDENKLLWKTEIFKRYEFKKIPIYLNLLGNLLILLFLCINWWN